MCTCMLSFICKIFKKIFMKIEQKKVLELVRYGVGGGIGAALNIVTAYILTSWLGFYYMCSYVIGSLVNYTFNFLYHRSITFNAKDKTAKRATYYYISNIFLGILALGLTYFFTTIIGLQYLISGMISTTAIIVINYLFSKFFTFNKTMK